MSDFLKARRAYQPRCPLALKNLLSLRAKHLPAHYLCDDTDRPILAKKFPKTFEQPLVMFSTERENEKITSASDGLRIGVVLSGGPAPGGHNVIAGLFEGLLSIAQDSKLYGFCGGPNGMLQNEFKIIDSDLIANYLNTGGFDMLGSGRTKIETDEQFKRCKDVLTSHGINGLCVIGGDDSNTNAALLAEYFAKEDSGIQVIGVPKTIDGDLKNSYVATSFGFDTAVRLYSELISNVARDALSAKKYYHFIKLMGRAASHITLDAAILTRPNFALISEDVAHRGLSLKDVVEEICAVIQERARHGKNYGVILVPEGVVEFIPEMKTLICELNHILAVNKKYIAELRGFTEQIEFINQKLSKDALYTLSGLPIGIQRQLLMERDPHGNVIVSQIETEKLLIDLVESRLAELKAAGLFLGSFGYQRHFFGYEGRCAAPTNFDADYAYSLGMNAAALFRSGYSGYMSVIYGLSRKRDQWQALGVPLTSMMSMEPRHGIDKPVIRRSVVDLRGPAFLSYTAKKAEWAHGDMYSYTGAIQYFGPSELCDTIPVSVSLEDQHVLSAD